MHAFFSTTSSSTGLETSSSLRILSDSSKGWCKNGAGTGGYNSITISQLSTANATPDTCSSSSIIKCLHSLFLQVISILK